MPAPQPPSAGIASPPDGPATKGTERIPPRNPTRRSLRGLDWFVLFVANVQTGFGPFISVYLTTQKWTQVDIGLVLTVGGLAALVGQMPGGMVVDAVRSERLLSGMALSVIAASAIAFVAMPVFPVIVAAAVLHSAASCLLGPAMAAISLGLVGHAAIGVRLGRNARFASMGNGLAAAAMGACGFFLSAGSVFIVTAALAVPALLALLTISSREIDPDSAHGGIPQAAAERPPTDIRHLFGNRPLLILAGCVMLFHLANAAMLPLVGSELTTRSSDWATVLIAACIVAPQIVVALFSPWVGRQAGVWGRRPLLLIAFGVLPIRGLLFALVSNPYLLVTVQLLDGISAAVLAVAVTLIIADLTRGTGHFNLGQGMVGTTVGVGAAVSTTLAGYLSDQYGSAVAFSGLAVIAAVGFAAVWALMPETNWVASGAPSPPEPKPLT
jgi:predicted MFS family arabinose efflux permease